MFGNSIEDEDFILRVSSKIELLKELKYYKHGEKINIVKVKWIIHI